jgi:elongator complex protein 1
MHNLKNIFLREVCTPENLHLSATAWDVDTDSVICTFGPTESSTIIDLKRKCSPASTPEDAFESIASWDAPCPSSGLSSDEIISLQYLSATATFCLIFAGGDLVVVRAQPELGEERIEIVGSVDAGIVAAAWAPDEELLAIATHADTLILMTRDLQPVTDVMLTAEDLKASKHVSVGWGKKETQFQGKRAKALRDPTMPESVDEGKRSPHDKGETSISWRGDGAFLAVNRLVSDNRRAIRIFTREGTIDSASEPVDGLESALSWRPAGNLLSSVQRLADRLDVIFFERNGLRHGEFSLRLFRDEMDTWASDVSLSWNIDSTVLAVSFCDRVQLWTMGNYHYYLKQEILFGSESHSRSRSVAWHPEKPLRMSAASTGMAIQLRIQPTWSVLTVTQIRSSTSNISSTSTEDRLSDHMMMASWQL